MRIVIVVPHGIQSSKVHLSAVSVDIASMSKECEIKMLLFYLYWWDFTGAVYVGLATIAGFVWWFLYSDNGPKLPYTELVSFCQ